VRRIKRAVVEIAQGRIVDDEDAADFTIFPDEENALPWPLLPAAHGPKLLPYGYFNSKVFGVVPAHALSLASPPPPGELRGVALVVSERSGAYRTTGSPLAPLCSSVASLAPLVPREAGPRAMPNAPTTSKKMVPGPGPGPGPGMGLLSVAAALAAAAPHALAAEAPAGAAAKAASRRSQKGAPVPQDDAAESPSPFAEGERGAAKANAKAKKAKTKTQAKASGSGSGSGSGSAVIPVELVGLPPDGFNGAGSASRGRAAVNPKKRQRASSSPSGSKSSDDGQENGFTFGRTIPKKPPSEDQKFFELHTAALATLKKKRSDAAIFRKPHGS
jgi:hypothetical protein